MAKAVLNAERSAMVKKGDGKSEFLLEIAAKTFLEEGFAGKSVGEMARHAHASKGTFYSRYVSKEQLFEAVMHRLVDRFTQELGAVMVHQDSPENVLTVFAAKILDRIASDEGIAIQRLLTWSRSDFQRSRSFF